MTMMVPSTLLRRAFVLDALASGGTGVLTAAGARILAGFCNLPESLLIYSGLSLLPFAAIVGLLARRDALPPAIVWAVIAYNALWSIDSIVLLLSGWVAPNAFSPKLNVERIDRASSGPRVMSSWPNRSTVTRVWPSFVPGENPNGRPSSVVALSRTAPVRNSANSRAGRAGPAAGAGSAVGRR